MFLKESLGEPGGVSPRTPVVEMSEGLRRPAHQETLSDKSVSDPLQTPVSDQPFGIELLKIPRSDIPAVTHVDYSARVQSIDPVRNPFIHGVLTRFKSLTGCSVIVNTSFNVRGEPIVNTAEDAYRCFMATEIDCLVVGNRFLTRAAQPHPPLDDAAREQWLKRFELD